MELIRIIDMVNIGNSPLTIGVGLPNTELIGTDITTESTGSTLFDGSGLVKLMPNRRFIIEESRINLGQIQNYIDRNHLRAIFQIKNISSPLELETLIVETNGQTDFTLSTYPHNNLNALLFIEGISYSAPTFFTISETTLKWLNTPFILQTNRRVEVLYPTAITNNDSVLETFEVETNGQTDFILSQTPNSLVILYINGQEFSAPNFFTITDTNITWSNIFTLLTNMIVEAYYTIPGTIVGETIIDVLTIAEDGQTTFVLSKEPKSVLTLHIEGLEYSAFTISGTTLEWLNPFQLRTTMRIEAYIN